MWIPVAMAVASAAMKAYGAIQQGNTESANAKAQANAMDYNAAVNTQNAQQSGMIATSREQQQRANQAQQLGNIRAGLAESGGGETGTNAGVLNQSETNMELDALTTRYQGVLGARSYNAQAGLDIYQGKVARVNAGAAKKAGYWGAASQLIAGAGSTYSAGQSAGYWGVSKSGYG
jgi:hypothetical protein